MNHRSALKLTWSRNKWCDRNAVIAFNARHETLCTSCGNYGNRFNCLFETFFNECCTNQNLSYDNCTDVWHLTTNHWETKATMHQTCVHLKTNCYWSRKGLATSWKRTDMHPRIDRTENTTVWLLPPNNSKNKKKNMARLGLVCRTFSILESTQQRNECYHPHGCARHLCKPWPERLLDLCALLLRDSRARLP